MIRRPPRFTLTDTLFPSTTLFRSLGQQEVGLPGVAVHAARHEVALVVGSAERDRDDVIDAGCQRRAVGTRSSLLNPSFAKTAALGAGEPGGCEVASIAPPCGLPLEIRVRVRPEERRVGKEGVSPGRSRWA